MPKRQLSLLLLYYFRFFARLQLTKITFVQKLFGKKLTIVGITGSAGKSSTLSACEAVLKDYFKVKTNSGSNSETGIPLNILNIKATDYSPLNWIIYFLLAPLKLIFDWQIYDIYLVEMGIDEPDSPKNMNYLLTILRPQIGIYLNVTYVHSQQFDKTVPKSIGGTQRLEQIISNIGREKAKMINQLSSSGYALLNLHDPVVKASTLSTLAKIIPLNPLPLTFDHYLPPPSFELSLGAAVQLAKLFNLTSNQATIALQKNLVLPPGRSTLLEGKNDTRLIDSSYNSSPLACEEMLTVLSKHKSPRIAVLGDMRELGLQSEIAHRHIYDLALKKSDTLISIGPETQKYFGAKAIKFTYWWQAADYLQKNLPLHATVLIKGSQNTIFLEELVKTLLLNKSDAKLLCRQSPYWLRVKARFQRVNS